MSSAPARKTLTLIDEIRAGNAETVTLVDALCAPIASSFTLSDTVPLPSDTRRGGTRTSKYPWSSMAVSQSFFVAGGKINTFYTLCTSTSKRMSRTSASPLQFIARLVVENGVTGVRVWRKA